MKENLRKVYHRIIPYRIRQFRAKVIQTCMFNKLLKKEKEYFNLHKNQFSDERKADIEKIFSLLKKPHHLILPEISRDIVDKCKNRKLTIKKDVTSGLFYVLCDDKKIFYKRGLCEKYIADCFNEGSLFNYYTSAHRYLSNNRHWIGQIAPPSAKTDNQIDFGVDEGDIVIDVGVADGDFSLSVIDKAKKIYLIEKDHEWIEALRHTFAPYKDKVEIIPKYLSDVDDEENITLKSLVKQYNIPQIDFIKIDVDGYERQVLKGGADIFKTPFVSKMALCVYHKPEDEVEFSDLVKQWGYNFYLSDGYMVMPYEGFNDHSIIRKGLIRAFRDNIK